MSFTYVIPDLHGRDDLLVSALSDISAHSRGERGVIVAIGDYVDKGPHSRQVVERLISGMPVGNLVALKGNHDAMMVQGVRDPAKLAFWVERGGDTALASYGGEPSDVPEAHIAWLDQRPLMHVDTHRVYVHAGVDPGLPLDQQTEARCYGSATRRETAQGSARATSCTAMTTILMDRCCLKAAAISTRRRGEPGG